MAILNPEHLFEQADALIAPPVAGPPRQADLRRAISTAYYGLFHFTLTAMADEFVGVSQRASGPYALVYRALDHRTFKEVCLELAKQTPGQKYAAYIPANGIGPIIQAFATAAIDLQEKRYRADYNPQPRFRTSDAILAITTARTATRRFARASAVRRKTFLALLLCPPRPG